MMLYFPSIQSQSIFLVLGVQTSLTSEYIGSVTRKMRFDKTLYMSDKTIKLTREELYRRMWASPASRLAKEFGVSDVMLGKLCRKFGIPKPYPGYWSQVAAGQRIQVPPLPKAKPRLPTIIFIDPSASSPLYQPDIPEVLTLIASEKQAESRICVASTLRQAHSLVRQTRKVIEQRASNGGQSSSIRRQEYFPVFVSKPMRRRALLVLDALVKALEARGHTIAFDKDSRARFVIGEEQVRVRLLEKSYRRERELSEREKREPNATISDRWIFTPSGKLTLTIEEYCSNNIRKNWTDSNHPLEDRLNEIMAGLIIVADALRVDRLEREEESRRRKEEEQRRYEEESKRRALNPQVESWIRSENLRTYLVACEKALVDRLGALAPDSPESRWLRWANGYADRLDPLKNGALEKGIKDAQTLETESCYNLF